MCCEDVWNSERRTKVASIWPLPLGVLRPHIVRWAAIGRVRRNGSGDSEGEVLRFRKQRQQKEQGKHGGLRHDGRRQRAAAEAAFAAALLRIAFDQAAS